MNQQDSSGVTIDSRQPVKLTLVQVILVRGQARYLTFHFGMINPYTMFAPVCLN